MTVFCDGKTRHTHILRKAYVSMTEDRIIAIASTRHWQEVGVCFGKWLEENLQKSGLHEAEGRSGGYAPPQLQFMVANKVARDCS